MDYSEGYYSDACNTARNIEVRVTPEQIDGNVIKRIYSDGNLLHVIDNHDCDTWIDTGVVIKDSLEQQIKQIEENYENQLQRQKVHISRGDRFTGHRVHGRNRKITIPKKCFRNSKGIEGMPNAT